MWIGGWMSIWMLIIMRIRTWWWCYVFRHIPKIILYLFISLLDESAVILDLTETSLERIIHTILNKMLDNLNAPLAYEEAMSTLFLPESGNILAKTIQVTCAGTLTTYIIKIYWSKQKRLPEQSWKTDITIPFHFSMHQVDFASSMPVISLHVNQLLEHVVFSCPQTAL